MNNQAENTNFVTQEIKTIQDDLKNKDLPLLVSELSKQTSYGILNAIYRDEGVIKSIFSILGQKKIDPAKLVADLSLGREEFKKQIMDNFSSEN